MRSINENFPFVAAGLFGALYCLVVFGLDIIDPRFDTWLLHGDTFHHYLGWLFFRQGAWTWPLGVIERWTPDLALTVIQTDSIPLLAILSKALSPLLPQTFQYTGWWLVTCYALQALFGLSLIRLLSKDFWIGFVGSAFFVLSPPLLQRFDHKSLCAHWLVLAGIYLYLAFAQNGRLHQTLARLTVLLCLALLIHPYFFAMLFPLNLAVLAHSFLIHKTPAKHPAYYYWIPGQLVLITSLAYAAGFFNIRSSTAWGWNLFSTDLLGFINSYGHSLFLPSIRYGGSQHEGYAYLGGGIILLGAMAVRTLFYSPQKSPFPTPIWPLLLTVVLLWVYALSGHVTFGGNTILKLDFLYDHFSFITGTFRASGRFLWPLYYFLLLSILLILLKTRALPQARLLLTVGLFIQCLDLYPWVSNRSQHIPSPQINKHQDWQWIVPQVKELRLVPARLGAEEAECGQNSFLGNHLHSVVYFAARNNLLINSTLAARATTQDVKNLCEKTQQQVNAAQISQQIAYVVDPRSAEVTVFKEKLGPLTHCLKTEDHWLCVDKTLLAAP